MPAVASPADDRTEGRQARPTMQREAMAALAEVPWVLVIRGLVLGWSQSLAFTLLCHESFGKVDPLFQLAQPLRQLIELVQAALKILQRLALVGVHHSRLARGQEPEHRYSGKYQRDDCPETDCGPEDLARNPKHATLPLCGALYFANSPRPACASV